MPVSDLCDEYHLHPTPFYRWQHQFFETGAAALAGASRSATAVLEAQIMALEAKLARQHKVLSELLEEYVRLKKRAWGVLKGRWVPPDIRD